MLCLRRIFVFFASLLIIIATLSGCSGTAASVEPAEASHQVGSDLAAISQAPAAQIENRSLAISGAFALFPMMTVWAEQFTALNPSILFDIQGGGAGKGMTDVLAGAVDIAMVSRDLRQEEIDQGAYGVPVTIDAVVATINADNPYLDEILSIGLTPEKAAAIWMSREIKTWGDLLGNGATEPITVYTRSDASGAGEMWSKYQGGEAQEDLSGTAVNGDPGLAEAVRQDRLGIGYNNIGFTYDLSTGEQIPGLRVVPLDLNGDGQIGPDEDFYGSKDQIAAAIGARVYPYPPARELYLVTKGEPDAGVAALYRWILTQGQGYVRGAGYVPLPPERITEALGLLGQ
ncbi:MAG: substrate-binding domain-containing protein [Chloroflexota bacterium]|jgi:phosphate transport system substrate-binding protein